MCPGKGEILRFTQFRKLSHHDLKAGKNLERFTGLFTIMPLRSPHFSLITFQHRVEYIMFISIKNVLGQSQLSNYQDAIFFCRFLRMEIFCKFLRMKISRHLDIGTCDWTSLQKYYTSHCMLTAALRIVRQQHIAFHYLPCCMNLIFKKQNLTKIKC